MENIITVNNENGQLLVGARELHSFVESKERFSKWWDRMLTYGFEKGMDYTPYQKVHPQNKQEINDFALKLNMAKEIAMIQRNEKGKQARLYFINCENKLKQQPIIHSYMIEDPIERAEKWIEEQKEKKRIEIEKLMLEQQVKEYQPKVTYYDEILNSPDALTITQIAKDYGKSGKAMNDILKKLKVQYKQSNQWLLYSKHQDKGYTKSETVKFDKRDGSQGTSMNTKWTQKGRLFIYDLLKQNDILPVMEKD